MEQQGLLGDWRQQFAGYTPYQQPVAPSLMNMAPAGSPIPMYGLTPDYIGLLSQQFPPLNFMQSGSTPTNEMKDYLTQMQSLYDRFKQNSGNYMTRQPGR